MRNSGSNIVTVLAVPLGLVNIKNPAPLRRRDAHHEIEFVGLGEFAPHTLEVAVVLRRHGETCAVVDAVVIEEYPIDFVPLLQRRFGELIGRVRRLMRVRPLVDDNSKTQILFPHPSVEPSAQRRTLARFRAAAKRDRRPQKCTCADMFMVLREPVHVSR